MTVDIVESLSIVGCRGGARGCRGVRRLGSRSGHRRCSGKEPVWKTDQLLRRSLLRCIDFVSKFRSFVVRTGHFC